VKNIVKNESDSVEDTLKLYFGPFGNIVKIIATQVDGGTHEAVIVFDSEESVKTALVVNGSKLNGKDISIENGPTSIGGEEDILIVNNSQDIFTTLIQSVNERVDDIDNRLQISKTLQETGTNIKEKVEEIDNKLQISKTIQETQTNIKEKVEEIDNKLQISKTIQEIPNQVSEVISKTKENLDESLKQGFNTLKIIGEKVSITTSNLGEKLSETTTSLGQTVSQVIQNFNR